MNLERELTSWTVAVIGSGRGKSFSLTEDLEIQMLTRAAEGTTGRYSIGRLLSPRDEAIDLTDGEWLAALDITRKGWKPDPARSKSTEGPDEPSGPSIRRLRGDGMPGQTGHPERGLLLLYVLDPAEAKSHVDPLLPPVVGFGISFPSSHSGTKVEYKVNNVAWTQEYGGAD